MPATVSPYVAALTPLLARALADGAPSALEDYLMANCRLPGPRLNLALVDAFAGCAAQLAVPPAPDVEPLAALLDGWAALPTEQCPGDAARVVLLAAAVVAYGAVGAARPDWWPDELTKIQRAAQDGRWRVRESAAQALQSLLRADWERGYAALREWVHEGSPLTIRAAVVGVAEPPLLTSPERGAQALALIEAATGGLADLAPEGWPAADVRVLRQALGYAWSVAVAAAPAPGFPALLALAGSADPDLRWMARENARKAPLTRWPAELAALRALLS